MGSNDRRRKRLGLLPGKMERMGKWMICLGFSALTLFWLNSCEKAPPESSATAARYSAITQIDSESQLNAAVASSSTRLVLIEFYADWCGPCRELTPVLEKLALEMKAAVGFYKLDVDVHRELATALGMTGIPFVVFFKDGKQILSLRGLQPRDNYVRIIREHGGASLPKISAMGWPAAPRG
jgi:thioredoxin 1